MHDLSLVILISLLVACDGIEATPDAGDGDLLPADPLMPRFEPEGQGWTRTPWPSDHRVDDQGHPELSDFPGARNPVIADLIDVIERDVEGFGTVPVIQVAFDRDPTGSALPEPADTLMAESPLQLIELGEGCGTRIPIESIFRPEGDEFTEPHTLLAAPVPGFPLDPTTTYAFIVLRELDQVDGQGTARPDAFDALISGESGESGHERVYAPMLACLSEAGIELDRVAVATVFTTQDPLDEMRRIREVSLDPDDSPRPEVSGWELVDSASNDIFQTYTGVYETPIFQRGETPYVNEGGGVELDAAGRPIIQRWEEVVMHLSLPVDGAPPFPVLIWEDGTGATPRHHISGEVFRNAIDAGFAVASFVPQFHGDRSGPDAQPELHTFNFLNPESARSVFRQQVVDTSFFIRVLREGLEGLEAADEIDPSILVYGGQSQGAIIGALVAGVETEIRAYVLNGVGAYMSITLVEVSTPTSYNELLRLFLGVEEPLDRFNPVLGLLQLGAEVADPINYARYWRGWDDHPAGNNIFLTNGFHDDFTPVGTMNAITIAGGAQPIDPAGWEVDPFGVWEVEPAQLPIEGNTEAVDGAPLTIATYLDADTGHYTIYDRIGVRAMATDFWVTSLDGVPGLRE